MKNRNSKNKISNMKGNEGITLVALIITIIILLILAVVAIGAVNNTGIIQYAQNSADEYADGRDKENTTLQNYLDYLNEYANTENMPAKTLNSNFDDFAEALDMDPNTYRVYDHKITYLSGNSKIDIKMGYHVGLPYRSKIFLTYTNEKGDKLYYAVCKEEYSIESFKDYFYAQDYVEPGSWAQYLGNNYTINDGSDSGRIYESITELPTFEGNWVIDEENSTATGIKYLSKVLIDV